MVLAVSLDSYDIVEEMLGLPRVEGGHLGWLACGVFKLARADYCRCLHAPFTGAQLEKAWLANAMFDAHRDDPAFGYRSSPMRSAAMTNTATCWIGWCVGSAGTSGGGRCSVNARFARVPGPARRP